MDRRAVVKFAPAKLMTRAILDLFELGKCEFKFYTSGMAQKLPFKTPNLIYGDMNFKSNNFCLIMEQVDAEFRDQLKPGGHQCRI